MYYSFCSYFIIFATIYDTHRERETEREREHSALLLSCIETFPMSHAAVSKRPSTFYNTHRDCVACQSVVRYYLPSLTHSLTTRLLTDTHDAGRSEWLQWLSVEAAAAATLTWRVCSGSGVCVCNVPVLSSPLLLKFVLDDVLVFKVFLWFFCVEEGRLANCNICKVIITKKVH